MPKPYRLLLVSTLPDRDQGGVELLLRELKNEFSQRVEKSVFVSKGMRFQSKGEFEYVVPMADIETKYRIPTIKTFAGFIYSLWSTFRTLRKVSPELVNVHYVDFGVVYWFLLKFVFGYKLIITGHGNEVSDMVNNPSSLRGWLLPKVLNRADGLTAVSPLVGGLLDTLAPTLEVKIIPNGIDLEKWHLPSQERKLGDQKRIVSVGRLSYVKGHDVLIKALANVVKIDEFRDVRCLIIGGGPEFEPLKHLVTKMGMQDNIVFTGQKNHKQILGYFSQASIWALASRAEGLPLAVLEAMAAGLAVVATSVGGIPDVIESGVNGQLVSPENPKELATAIATLLSDRELQAKLVAQAKITIAPYSQQNCVDTYLAYFDSVLQVAEA